MTGRIARIVAGTAVLLGCAAVGTVAWHHAHATDEPAAAATPSASRPAAVPTTGWTYTRDGAETLVKADGKVLATFTDGARTTQIAGPARTFREPKFTRATVTLHTYVRLAPQEWHAGAEQEPWFHDWLAKELTDSSPDVIGIAFQYAYGAPDLTDTAGVRYAGDAQFGPYSSTDPDGRAENNDFNDYLGITYDFTDAGPTAPRKDRYGDVDCSGFIRLVYGYRLGYPLRRENTPGAGLPRRAFAISSYGPGLEVIPNTGKPARDYGALLPGDLVFFDVDPSNGPVIDHSGIFIGVDDHGHYRFISSRTLANGPTMGDSKYAAILDGSGHFALTFRNARRL